METTHGHSAALQSRFYLLGIPVDAVDVARLNATVTGYVRDRRRATVLHVNVHAMNLAARHGWFADTLRAADLVFCDGHGVLLASRVMGHRLPERITYADWAWDLARLCEAEGLGLYLLGGRHGVAALAADRLREGCPRLRVAGTHHGYFDLGAGSAQSCDVIDAVNAARPDVVLVGLGMPAQERWVRDHRAAIDAPVVLTGGAVFDYVSGRLARAPAWMTRHGLEWLGRLAIEPRRMAWRYLAGNPLFAARVLRARLALSARRGR